MDIFVISPLILTIFLIISFRHTSFFKSRTRGFSGGGSNFSTKDNMAVIITLSILITSLIIILSGKYEAGTQNWAFVSIGALMGFWLRNPR